MITRLPQRTGYSRTENISDLIVHAVGLSAAVLAVPILILRAWFLGTEPTVVLGVTIYGAALISMILCSTLYNMAHPDVWSGLLRRLDHLISLLYATPMTQGGHVHARLHRTSSSGPGCRLSHMRQGA